MFQLAGPMTHREQPGTRGSPAASKAARLSTPEWGPGKNLGPYRPSETAPAPDGAWVDKKKKKRGGVERKGEIRAAQSQGEKIRTLQRRTTEKKKYKQSK